MTKPMVGEKVWFRRMGVSPDLQPYDATILYVITDECVSLIVNDHGGKQFYVNTCHLWGHENSDRPSDRDYCEWPPQKPVTIKLNSVDFTLPKTFPIQGAIASNPWSEFKTISPAAWQSIKGARLERMEDEAKELETRLRSLNSFMATSEWERLSDFERELALSQRKHMKKYLRFLSLRIELIP